MEKNRKRSRVWFLLFRTDFQSVGTQSHQDLLSAVRCANGKTDPIVLSPENSFPCTVSPRTTISQRLGVDQDQSSDYTCSFLPPPPVTQTSGNETPKSPQKASVAELPERTLPAIGSGVYSNCREHVTCEIQTQSPLRNVRLQNENGYQNGLYLNPRKTIMMECHPQLAACPHS